MVSSDSSGILWQALRIIERTVLPRTITFRTARGRLDLDVSGQSVLICPKLEGAFVVDEQFRQEAPRAFEVVRRGLLAQGGQLPQENAAAAALAMDREALLRLWGRALMGLCEGTSRMETTIEVDERPPCFDAEMRRRLGFTALELMGALSPHITAKADSQVFAFYAAQKQTAPDSWLFHLAGWPAAFPGEVADLGRVSEMGEAAQTIKEWRNTLAAVPGPIMGVMMGPQQEAFRCVAVDDVYVALVSRPSSELGAALAAWRMAQPGKPMAQSSP